MIYTKHILGAFAEGVQRCIVCGEIIHDYRGVMYETQEAADSEKGWMEGEFWISDGNPQMLTSIEPEEEIKNCQ